MAFLPLILSKFISYMKNNKIPHLRSSRNHFSTDESVRHYRMETVLQGMNLPHSKPLKTFQKPSQGLVGRGLPLSRLNNPGKAHLTEALSGEPHSGHSFEVAVKKMLSL